MNIKRFLLAAMAVLTLAGCQKENEGLVEQTIKLGETTLNISGLGDTKTVSVTSNCSWKAGSDVSWIQVAPSTGTASTKSISIQVAQNETGKDRTGIVSVVSEDGSARCDLQIAQSGELAPSGLSIKDAASFNEFLKNASSSTEADEYTVLADIDMAGATIEPAISFAGKLDGQGHKIYNFKVESAQVYAGVFLTNVGTIKNITFGSKDGKAYDNTSVITFKSDLEAANAAGIVGYNKGTLENVVNFAAVTFNVPSPADAYAAVGGVAGKLGAVCVVDGCENHGAITMPGTLAYKSSMGGVIGFNEAAGAEVKNCKNFGEVTKANINQKEFTIGGVVGRTDVVMVIDNCVNEGAVSYTATDAPGSYIHIAGIIAAMYNGTSVTNCTNKGAISSSILQVNRIGGIVGTMNTGGLIEKCTNDGEIKIAQAEANNNWQAIGGILGFQEKGAGNAVKNCVNNGAVSMTVENATTHANKINAGGIVGLTALAMEISSNVNNGTVTVVNKAAGAAYAAGIVGWIKGADSFTTGNENKGKVSCATSDNAAAYAGGVVANNSAATTTNTGDKNTGDITCANAAGTGSIAGVNAGQLLDCVAAGSVAGVKLDDSNFVKLAVGTNTGKIENLKSPSGSSASAAELALEKTSAIVKAEDTTASFNVQSNVAWTVTTDAAWVTEYTKSGEKNGTVEIKFAANTSTTDDRSAVFTVKAQGANDVTFTLTQGKVLDSAPHAITNAEELALFAQAAQAETPDFSRWANDAGVITLAGDIDATALKCFPIEVIPAGVVVDGCNHTLKLAIDLDGEYVSVFKTVKGTVKNFKTTGSVKSSYTGGNEYRTAALVSVLEGGLVENCVNDAEIIAAATPSANNKYADVGGVVCLFKGDGVAVRNCVNNGKITLTSGSCAILGGVVAYGQTDANAPTLTVEGLVNNGEIIINHAGGNWDYVGGVVGKMGASSNPFKMFTIKDCKSNGKITLTKGPKVRGGGLFGSCGVSTDYLVTGCEFAGDIEIESVETVDRIFAGVGPGFNEANASGTISNCIYSGKINVVPGSDPAVGGNIYISGIYGNNGAATVVIDGCKTTSKSVINACGMVVKSVGVIACRPNKAGFTIKNCKIAGSVNKGEGAITIAADNIEDWMYKGTATTVDVTLTGNGFNAE